MESEKKSIVACEILNAFHRNYQSPRLYENLDELKSTSEVYIYISAGIK